MAGVIQASDYKKTGIRIIYASIFALLCVILSPVLFIFFTIWSWQRVYEVQSPSAVGSALYYTDGYGGMDGILAYDVCVRDYEKSGSKAIHIKTLTTRSWPAGYVDCWSYDGTVLALGEQNHVNDPVRLYCAYDFKDHKLIEDGTINRLITVRGGKGKSLFAKDVTGYSTLNYPYARHVWPWENFPSY